MKIYVSPLFRRRFRKLPALIKEKAWKRERIFISDPFHPSLETHKLHGKQSYEWAYSIDYSYRVAFVFLDSQTVLYTDVGTHDQLYS